MIRTLLFDIDGTLLTCHQAGKNAFLRASEDVFGTIGAMESVHFQGQTDLKILHRALEPAGIDAEQLQSTLPVFKERYFYHLEQLLQQHEPVILPGVRELLHELANNTTVHLALLTGNFRRSAYLKLATKGLDIFFDDGVFADNTFERNDMPALARTRYGARFGIAPDDLDLVIIGDTVHDISCARAGNALAIAVASGWTSYDELAAGQPDHVFENLSDLDAVLRILV